jgi:hypothetical protein
VTLRVGSTTLRGLVVRSGQPIRASIAFLRESGGRIVSATVSKDDGSFEVSNLSAGRWELKITPMTGKTASLFVDLPETGVVDKTFVLPSSAIVGRVVDGKGQPLDNALVLLVLKDPGTAFQAFPATTRTAMTASDGTFRIDEMSPGREAVVARKDPMGSSKIVEVEVPAQGDSAPVELRVGSEETGTLVSTALSYTDGGPIPSAWCLLSTPYGRMGHAQRRDAKGVMRIANLPVGKYHVQVSANAYSVSEHDVEIRAGETVELTDVLYQTGSFRWTLVDGAGAGVAGAQCSLVAEDPNSIEGPRQGQSDAQGLWTVRGILPGRYRASASRPGKQPLTISVSITPDQLTIENCTMP